MNRRERFFAALEGREVDRVPVTAWVHFLSDHLTGEQTASLHIAFLHEYGWDIAKLMNDYRYPLPPGLERIDSAEQMRRFKRLPMTMPAFAEQLNAIRVLRRALGPEWPILDTLFDPYQQIARNVGFSQACHIAEHPDAALEMLEAVTATLCDYVREAKAAGADGFFYSINSAIPAAFPRGADEATFRRFQRPFDLRLLEATRGSVRVLHAHGSGIDFERVRDYPCEAISFADRSSKNPTLAQMRGLTDKCLMGGLDETTIQEKPLADLRAQIDDAFAQAGRRNFILAPGCTVPSFTPRRSLRCLREHTR